MYHIKQNSKRKHERVLEFNEEPQKVQVNQRRGGIGKKEQRQPKDDIQGVDWQHFQVNNRLELRSTTDNQAVRYSRWPHPKLMKSSLVEENFHGKCKKFYPLKSIENYHLQLHHNFKAISPRDFVYPTLAGIELFNTENMRITSVPGKPKTTCIDYFEGILGIIHSDNYLAIYDLAKSGLKKPIFEIELNERLSNHLQLYKDFRGSLRCIVCGNSANVVIYDLESLSPEPLKVIQVGHFTNHLTVDPESRKLVLGYDHSDVDVYDLNSGNLINKFLGHKDFTFGTDWHKNGYFFATGNQDLSTMIWDLRSSRGSVELLPSVKHSASTVKFVNDSKYLVVGEYMSYINFYRTDNFEVKSTIDYFGYLSGFDCVEQGDGAGSMSQNIGGSFGLSTTGGCSLFAGIAGMYDSISGGIFEIEIDPLLTI